MRLVAGAPPLSEGSDMDQELWVTKAALQEALTKKESLARELSAAHQTLAARCDEVRDLRGELHKSEKKQVTSTSRQTRT